MSNYHCDEVISIREGAEDESGRVFFPLLMCPYSDQATFETDHFKINVLCVEKEDVRSHVSCAPMFVWQPEKRCTNRKCV